MPPRKRDAKTVDSSSPVNEENNEVTTDTLFGDVELVGKIQTNSKRITVDVPAHVLQKLKEAQELGSYAYWAVNDPSQYDTMANVLRSGGDLMDQASVLVKPVIREGKDFHVVTDPADATHIRATVAKRRGFKSGSRDQSE